MPRGGRRPGAGAPKGNLNGLKHGRRSAQLAQLGYLLAASPTVRETFLGIGDRMEGKQMKAAEAAAKLLTRLVTHAEEIASGKPSPGPFAHYLEERLALGGPRDVRSKRRH